MDTVAKTACGLLLAAAVTLPPSSARAQFVSRSARPQWVMGGRDPRGTWLPVGVTVGGTFATDVPKGTVVGAELSVVDFPLGTNKISQGAWWLGAVADVVWDFGAAGLRHRLGLETGTLLWGEVPPVGLGLELGYVGERREEDAVYRPGFNARLLLVFGGVLSAYGGYNYIANRLGGSHFGEAGALIKFPIPLAVEGL